MEDKKNHHIVSQVHQKGFYNENGEIFVYNKENTEKNRKYKGENYFDIKTKNSSKNLMSEEYSNSVFKNNEINNNFIEEDLNKNFENDFLKHKNNLLSIIKNVFLKHGNIFSDRIQFQLKNSSNYLFKIGIISKIRNPIDKKNTDKILSMLDDTLIPIMNGNLKNDWIDCRDELKKTKYSNILSPSEYYENFTNKLGEFFYEIYVPSKNCFILTDNVSLEHRTYINDKGRRITKQAIDKEQKIEWIGKNLIKMSTDSDNLGISIIEFPICNKIYLKAYSSLIREERKINIQKINPDGINFSLLRKMNKFAICDNKNYLEYLLKNMIK